MVKNKNCKKYDKGRGDWRKKTFFVQKKMGLIPIEPINPTKSDLRIFENITGDFRSISKNKFRPI